MRAHLAFWPPDHPQCPAHAIKLVALPYVTASLFLLPVFLHPHLPRAHSSTSWLQAGPVYPEGQVQMALPLTGFVSQLEPSLQGLLIHASLRWHSRPRQGGCGEWALRSLSWDQQVVAAGPSSPSTLE